MISLFRLNYQFYSPLYTVVLLLFYLSDGHYVVLCQSYTIKQNIDAILCIFFFLAQNYQPAQNITYNVFELFWCFSGAFSFVLFWHCMEESSLNILQNDLFCVPWTKVSHTGLEWHKGDYYQILCRLSSCLSLLSFDLLHVFREQIRGAAFEHYRNDMLRKNSAHVFCQRKPAVSAFVLARQLKVLLPNL